MAYQKLQPGRGTNISSRLRSDTTDNVVLSDLITAGASDAVGVAGELNDAGGAFITNGVRIGDVIKNNSVSGQVTTVSGVISETRLILSDSNAIYFPTDVYQIYRPPIEAAVLSVSKSSASTSDIKITTSGGDDVTLYGLQDGTYIPIQTKRVWETIGDNLVLNGDFKLGEQVIYNGNFTGIGIELVTDGNFPSGTSAYTISPASSWTLEDGYAEGIGNSTANYLQQPFTVTNDKVYKFVYEVLEDTLVNAGTDKIGLSGSGAFQDSGVAYIINSSVGVHTYYLAATNAAAANTLRLFIGGSNTAGSIKITNISFKEVGNPWTLLNSDSSHYVEFPGTGARFVSDTLTPLMELAQTSVVIATKPYVVTCNVNYAAGSGDLKCNVGGVAPTAFTEGFNTKAVTSGAGTVFSFIGGALNVDATISDVFVYKVGMNWIASGSEVIFNNGYTELIIDAVNSNVGIISSGVFQSGVDYKVEVTMKATASFDAEILESNGAVLVSTIGNPSLTTEYQDFTYEFTGTGAYDLFIHRDSTAASSNQTIYIKSVSVRKLGDPNTSITALF